MTDRNCTNLMPFDGKLMCSRASAAPADDDSRRSGGGGYRRDWRRSDRPTQGRPDACSTHSAVPRVSSCRIIKKHHHRCVWRSPSIHQRRATRVVQSVGRFQPCSRGVPVISTAHQLIAYMRERSASLARFYVQLVYPLALLLSVGVATRRMETRKCAEFNGYQYTTSARAPYSGPWKTWETCFAKSIDERCRMNDSTWW